jgi:hypothetical protein
MLVNGDRRFILKGSIASIVQVRHMFTCHVDLAEGDTDESAGEEYLDQMFEDIKAFLTTSLTYTSFEIQANDGTSFYTVDEHSMSWTGTGSGDFLPNAVAVVMIGKAIGKRLMGRKFWSGITEAAAVANALGGSSVAAFAQCAVDYVSPFTTTNGGLVTPGIADKTHTFRPFVSGLVSTLLGSMRRRKPGIGI